MELYSSKRVVICTLRQHENVAKYACRKILLENLAKLTARMHKSRADRRWKLEIFLCLPSNFVFRNSCNICQGSCLN